MTTPYLDVVDCPLEGLQVIEASAGTGKTWNICALYLRLLLERELEVSQILVVTFTNAATAELRQRVRDRIADTLRLVDGGTCEDAFLLDYIAALRERQNRTDEAMAARLRAALQNFDEASIFTIHAFCQRALADAPFASGIPLNQKLLPDDSELVMEVARDFWRKHIAGRRLPRFLTEVLERKRDSPETFAELLKRRLRKPLSTLLWPEGPDGENEQSSADSSRALDAAYETARALWQREREVIVKLVEDALPRLDNRSYKDKTIATCKAEWDDVLLRGNLFAKNEKLQLFSADILRKRAKKENTPPDHPFFDCAAQLLAHREQAEKELTRVRTRLLRDLLSEGPAAVRRAKRERRVVAFDDMLYNLYERLTCGAHGELASDIRAQFPAALIDEFQDTDPLQFAIFKLIYGDSGAPVFLVGDPKQAIYSFRNADLHTYLEARAEAKAEYTLGDNQRSTRELIDALNALFSNNPAAFMMPGLAYRPVRLGQKERKELFGDIAGRAPLQVWTLPKEPPLKSVAKAQAARACAVEIARLVAAGQRGEMRIGDRSLSAGDIAVLVRTHREGRAMRQALAVLGLRSVELSQESVFHSPDAEEIERLLVAILEPARERLLRAALATELMGLDAAAIDALDDDEERLSSFVEHFAEYRETWQRRGIGVMLRQFFTAEGVARRMVARPDGERRLTNLLHLVESLHGAAQSHPSPDMLVRWLQERRADEGTGDADQLRLESDRDLVSIVTIHKSKGLEYQIVFCPFLWDGYQRKDSGSTDGTEYHDDDGRAVMDFVEREAAEKSELAMRRSLEQSAERLRLIYVALTRAVHRCYLVVGGYLSRFSPAESQRSLLNWLAAGAGRSPAQWLKDGAALPEIDAAWSTLAQANEPNIAIAPLPLDMQEAPEEVLPAPEDLAPLEPPHVPTAWWMGSYTALTHGAAHERAAIDHDARLLTAERTADAATAEIAADDILRFPRGRNAGSCVHAVFENSDFTDPATWPPAIDTALRTYPPETAGGAGVESLRNMLANMLRDVTATPLPDGMRIGELAVRRRVVELEFTLPSQRLTAAGLAAVLERHQYPMPPLAFAVLDGYLRGFIDLIFEHGGRYYVADWKSNYLGDRGSDYDMPALERAMDDHGYHLQYLLYSVALHRYLRCRRADYDFERHFGGVYYLFVRGMRPTWTGTGGRATGVYYHRPGRDVVADIDTLLAGTGGRV